MARAAPQSAHRYPLTAILGTDANVRILRELSRHGGQLSAPSLVSRTGIAKTSVWAGLTSLEQAGVVSVAGTGRARLYSIRSDHPLRGALDALFEAEERRFDEILQAIREAARSCGHDVAGVWVYGSTARGEDRRGSDLDIAVVAAGDAPEKVSQSIRDALRPAGDRLGFVPSVAGIAPKDAARLAKDKHPWWIDITRDAIVLLGVRPEELARPHRGARTRRSAA
jgi:predicted nucleotidyltransferase